MRRHLKIWSSTITSIVLILMGMETAARANSAFVTLNFSLVTLCIVAAQYYICLVYDE